MEDLKSKLLNVVKNPPLVQQAETAVLKTVKCEFESHKGDHPKYNNPLWKIYGPYLRDDNRRHVVAYDGNNRVTISYPKFIMECYLKRLLDDNEEVHHKNEITSDDRLDNYEVINSTEHRHIHTNDSEVFYCPACGKVFSLSGVKLSRLKTERKRFPNRKGPYCSKSCAGQAGK